MLRLQPFCLNWGTFCKYFKSNTTGAVIAASQSPGCSSHRLVSVPAAGQPLVWTSKTIKRLKIGHVNVFMATYRSGELCLPASWLQKHCKSPRNTTIFWSSTQQMCHNLQGHGWMDRQTDGWAVAVLPAFSQNILFFSWFPHGTVAVTTSKQDRVHFWLSCRTHLMQVFRTSLVITLT